MTVKTILAATALLLPAGMAAAQAQAADPQDGAAAARVQADTGVGTETPAADAGAAARAGVATGATIRDPNGGTVGTIESVEGDTAVLSTGTVKVGVPLSAIGKNDRGLVIAMSKAEIEAAAAAAASN